MGGFEGYRKGFSLIFGKEVSKYSWKSWEGSVSKGGMRLIVSMVACGQAKKQLKVSISARKVV